MKVFLATDHAGFPLKEVLRHYLHEQGYEIVDCGAKSLQPGDDYPDYISKAALEVSHNPGSFGIIVGKSGAGEAICANKIKGIRCAQGFLRLNVQLCRQHNNANMLSFGSDFIHEDMAKSLVDIFLKTPFSGDPRHQRRIDEISAIENENL